MTRISTDEEERILRSQKRLSTLLRNFGAKRFADDSHCTIGPPSPPYPFCRTPERCAGKGYCPADIACND